MALHVVMVTPEIPQNTGNVARTCAATDTVLHLVKPLGFDISEKAVRRAGLDYWPYVDLRVYENLEEFLAVNREKRKFFVTTKGKMYYHEVLYRDEDMLVFGRETAGLPRELIKTNEDSTVRIPMSANTRTRSLNLANSVNIVLFEALRQNGFRNLD